MYMHGKGFVMHSPQSPIYGETLARYTRAVYPLDFFGRWHAGGPTFQCFRRECLGRRRNPSKTYMGTYDIYVKIY
jgi:hypothetical protein